MDISTGWSGSFLSSNVESLRSLATSGTVSDFFRKNFSISSELIDRSALTKTLTGGNGADLIIGGSGQNRLYGGNGNDILVGGNAANYFDGGNDDDIMIGGKGNDSYMFSSGNDVIIDAGGTSDKLYLRTSVKLSDLSYVQDGRDIVISDSRLGSTIRIVDHFGGGKIEYLRMGDGTLLDLNAALGVVDSSLSASPPSNSNSGSNSTPAEKPATLFIGTTANDDFHFGEGTEAFHIQDSGGQDVIQTNSAFADLSFTISGNDLVISDTRTHQTLIVDKQYAGQTVETLRLANGAEIALTGKTFVDPTAFQMDAKSSNLGGVNANLYRGESVVTGTGAADGNPNDAHVVTVALGTTAQQLEKMIADAQPGTTFLLQAGTYTFDTTLHISRSDVTLKGAGEGMTTILTTVTGADAISVQAAWQKESWGNIEASEAKLNTTLTTAAGEHDTTVKLKSVAGIQVGDYIEISQNYTGGVDSYATFKGTLVEVTGVDAATGTVTLAHEVGFNTVSNATVKAVTLLHNVVLGDFTLDYGTPQNAVDAYRYENNNLQYVGEGGTGTGNGVRAIFLNSIADSALYNVTIHNAGSKGVVVREAVGIEVNGLTVDGAQNLGDGGNGYGLEIARTYFSDFNNLTFEGLIRHAVTFSKDGSSAYNNVHILSSTANIDFHGGPDYKNIYYVENMDLSQLKDDYAFNGIDYRDASTQKNNTVIFDNFTGADAVTITKVNPNYKPINYTGHDAATSMNNYSGARDDIIVLGEKGGTIFTGAGNDTITLGSGVDNIRTGSGNDVVIYHAGSGHDTILDFDVRYDKITLMDHSALGLNNLGEVLSHSHMDGANLIIDFGNGDTLSLAGVALSSLTDSSFIFG